MYIYIYSTEYVLTSMQSMYGYLILFIIKPVYFFFPSI